MNGLFVSAEHQDLVAHRQHPCFRGTFYVFILLLIFQIPMVGIWVLQANAQNKQRTVSEGLQRDKRVMDADEHLLLPITHKIEQAAEWHRVLAERKRVGDALARLESSIPPNACLNQVSIRNTASDTKSPDRIEIRAVGWLKGEANEVSDRLKTQFPGYVVSSNPISSDGTDVSGAKAVEFSIVPAQ